MAIRQLRQYTDAQGWHREPTKFEVVRDFAKDSLSALGKLAVKPNLSGEALYAARREAYYRTGGRTGDKELMKPLAARVRYGRLAAIAGAATGLIYAVNSIHGTVTAETPAIEQPPAVVYEQPTQKPKPTFTASQRKNLTAIYNATKKHWTKHKIDRAEIEQTQLVLLSGETSYLCKNDPDSRSHEITPSDSSEYCGETNALVITPASVNSWATYMGERGSEFQVVTHEFGHRIQEITGDEAGPGDSEQPFERGADCYSGRAMKALDPADINTVYEALGLATPDIWHGDPSLLASAYMAGTQGKPCNSQYFPSPVS